MLTIFNQMLDVWRWLLSIFAVRYFYFFTKVKDRNGPGQCEGDLLGVPALLVTVRKPRLELNTPVNQLLWNRTGKNLGEVYWSIDFKLKLHIWERFLVHLSSAMVNYDELWGHQSDKTGFISILICQMINIVFWRFNDCTLICICGRVSAGCSSDLAVSV